ncbi:MAG: mevalonate kinase [Lactovum sp.]
MLTIKVPGKLFIAGEYAVTRAQGLALLAAVETDFSVTISESNQESRLQTNVGIPSLNFSMKNLEVDYKSPWNFVLASLKSLADKIDVELLITIQSDLGYQENKKGYGSSASVVVGVVKAMNQFFQLQMSLSEEFDLAARVHYQVQGSGSMGDVAAIVYGGFIFYRNQNLIEPLLINWELFVISTGKSVKTDEKLKIRLAEKFYQQSDQLVLSLKEERDFKRFKSLLLKNQELLIGNLPAAYLTKKLSLALKIVNSHPHLVGKVSGAGFGENIIIFSKGIIEAELDLLQQSLNKYDMKMERIYIAPTNSKRYPST